MGRGKPLRRGTARRPELRRVLIYCEGENTETQYFKGLRADLNGLNVNVQLGSSHGTPSKLVRDAVKHKNRAPQSREDRFTAYDDVWCVMDVEAPKPHPDLADALRDAKRGGVRVVLSNPCFELWVLLHRCKAPGWKTSDQLQKLLESHAAFGYDATRKKLDYPALRDGIPNAIAEAARLRDREEASRKGYEANPWTDVDRLVSDLLAQRDEARS